MKLEEVELICRLLRNKGSQKYKTQMATHSQPFQALHASIKRPLLLTGSLVFRSELLWAHNPQLNVSHRNLL